MIDAPAPAVSIAGTWTTEPLGVILHGSRSGVVQDAVAEFHGTSNWAMSGALDSEGSNLGWNATIGPGLVAKHIDCGRWGWSARRFSQLYLAIEFAQPRLIDPIDDASVEAFVWWFLNVARARWPNLPATFPTHAELDRSLPVPDGKTDCFVDGTVLRQRIMALLG